MAHVIGRLRLGAMGAHASGLLHALGGFFVGQGLGAQVVEMAVVHAGALDGAAPDFILRFAATAAPRSRARSVLRKAGAWPRWLPEDYLSRPHRSASDSTLDIRQVPNKTPNEEEKKGLRSHVTP